MLCATCVGPTPPTYFYANRTGFDVNGAIGDRCGRDVVTVVEVVGGQDLQLRVRLDGKAFAGDGPVGAAIGPCNRAGVRCDLREKSICNFLSNLMTASQLAGGGGY